MKGNKISKRESARERERERKREREESGGSATVTSIPTISG